MAVSLLFTLLLLRPVETQPATPTPSVAFSLGYCLYEFENWPKPDMVIQRRMADARLLIARMRGEAEADKGYEDARIDTTARRETSNACARQCGQKKWTDPLDSACYRACIAKVPPSY